MSYLLNRDVIRRHVGATSFARGEAYFHQNRVRKLAFKKPDEISAQVWGHDVKPYEVFVYLGRTHIADSNCSCPMDSSCKHVAAVCLQALKLFPEKFTASTPKPKLKKKVWTFTGKTKTAVWKPLNAPTQGTTAFTKKPKPTKVSLWERQLQNAFTQESSPATHTLELMFMAVAPKVYGWQRSSSTRDNPSELQVRLRLRDLKTRKSSVSLAQWSDVYYEYRQSGVEARLGKKITEILARLASFLFKFLPPYGGSGQWMTLPEQAAGEIWRILLQLHSSGVKFFSGQQGELLLEMAAKSLGHIVSIGDKGSSLHLHSTLALEGVPLEAESLVFGSPPVFALVNEKQSTDGTTNARLYPVEQQLNTAWILPKNLEVPSADVEKFCAEFLPVLVQHTRVYSRSSRVMVPQLGVPKLSVNVKAAGTDSIVITHKWAYGEISFPVSHVSAVLDSLDGKKIARSPKTEQLIHEQCKQIAAALGHLLVNQESGMVNDHVALARMQAAKFVKEILPILESSGDIQVLREGDIPLFAQDFSEPEIALTVAEQANASDWFDLGIKIKISGHDIPFVDIFAALESGQEHLFLPNGSFVSLQTETFDKLKTLIRQAAKLPDAQGSGQMQISRFQAGWWEELKNLGVVEQQSKAWQKSMAGLLSTEGIGEVTASLGLRATLRPYQLDGFRWLWFLRGAGLGGILADDMGLGKTVQSLAVMVRVTEEEGKHDPFLIVAPTSVVENWDTEMEKFAPHLKRVVMRRGDRRQEHKQMKEADVVIISYALLHRDAAKFVKRAWDTVIIDEAQSVKNYQAKTYNLIRTLPAKCRFALTGTPLENNTMELWAIFSIVSPGLFPEPERFKEVFQRPIEKEQSKLALEQLRRRIRPFLLRRRKDVVASELPAKTEQVLWLELEGEQRRLYDLFLQKIRMEVLDLLSRGGMKENRFKILTGLLRLRQLCLHPGLVDAKYKHAPSAKLDLLLENIETLAKEGHKLLIFSQFTTFLAKARECLDKAKLSYAYLDGATKNRKAVVEKFQTDPTVPVFLISLKAGGVGLNLTAADYCIMLDPWWNPAVEAQAIDRTHRIGQTKPVMVYRFIAKNTIEEKVLKLQERKRALFKNILEDGDAFGSLITEDDIRGLVA